MFALFKISFGAGTAETRAVIVNRHTMSLNDIFIGNGLWALKMELGGGMRVCLKRLVSRDGCVTDIYWGEDIRVFILPF
jgi:hypothetical protein